MTNKPLNKKTPTTKLVKRGEIYFAKFSGEIIGSEQSGERPVLILQNDVGNRFSPTTIVAFITSEMKGMDLPIHKFLLKELSLLPSDSIILLEQLRTIDKNRLLNKVSILDEEMMQKVNLAILISMGLDPSYK
jgi:mRNA interferase MazF